LQKAAAGTTLRYFARTGFKPMPGPRPASCGWESEAIVLPVMRIPPRWFLRAAEPRIAGYIGNDAAALWVRSRFWYLVAWILWAPIGLTCFVLASSSSSPGPLWLVVGVAWPGGLAFGALSIATGSAADKVASAFLSEIRGYRMSISCPITLLPSQWTRAVARADTAHQAHVELARTAGTAAAIDQLVEQRKVERRLWPVALALVGFLGGFVLGVLVAFLINQTKSLGVLLVFCCAFLCAYGLPRLLRPRFERASQRYRAELTAELSQEVGSTAGIHTSTRGDSGLSTDLA